MAIGGYQGPLYLAGLGRTEHCGDAFDCPALAVSCVASGVGEDDAEGLLQGDGGVVPVGGVLCYV